MRHFDINAKQDMPETRAGTFAIFVLSKLSDNDPVVSDGIAPKYSALTIAEMTRATIMKWYFGA